MRIVRNRSLPEMRKPYRPTIKGTWTHPLVLPNVPHGGCGKPRNLPFTFYGEMSMMSSVSAANPEIINPEMIIGFGRCPTCGCPPDIHEITALGIFCRGHQTWCLKRG